MSESGLLWLVKAFHQLALPYNWSLTLRMNWKKCAVLFLWQIAERVVNSGHVGRGWDYFG